MDFDNQQHKTSTDLSLIQPVEQTAVKNFMANVFAYMFMALGISALFAYLFSTNLYLLAYLMNPAQTGLNALGYVVMLAPIGFVLLMSFGYSRLSATDVKKASILGALNLYLDFINLFLFLLRLFGGRRN